MSDSALRTLLEEGREMLEAVRTGGSVELLAIREWVRAVRTEAELASRSEGEAALAVLADLTRALQHQQDVTARELARIGGRRRAVRGYGSVRSHKKAQRVFKKA